jgi:hypothetical protein
VSRCNRLVTEHDFTAAEKFRFERFVSGHGFSRADMLFIFLSEPALAGDTS